VAITLGPADVSLVNVRDIVLNHLGITDVPVRTSKDAIVWNDRLPRALVAAAGHQRRTPVECAHAILPFRDNSIP
jgi:ABC-type Fe3+-siderophore transport system permease subunit